MDKNVKNTALYLLQIFVSGILVLVLMPIISRYLLPIELGKFVLAQVYTGLAVGIANFGILTGYERNFFIFEKSIDQSSKLISSALIFVLINLLLLMAIVYVFQLEISSIIFQNDYPRNLLIIVLIGTSTTSLSQFYLTYLKNSGLAINFIKYTITSAIIYFIIAVLTLIQTDLGPMSLAYAWAISNSVLLLMLFIKVGRGLPFKFDSKILVEMLKISLPLTPRVFFGYLNTQFDKILLGFIGSTGSVGIYHLGQTLALTIFQFMTGLGRVFQPEVYRKLFAAKHSSGSNEIHTYLLPFFYLSILIAISVALFSKELVILMFNNTYIQANIIIIILSMYYASMFFGKIIGMQLIFAKKTHLTTLLMFVGIAINVGLNIPFIIYWGIEGAAWATTISGIIMTIIGYFVAQKYAFISWQWRQINLIHLFFILSVIWSILDYNKWIEFGFLFSLIIKFFLLFSYLLLGIKLKIIKKNTFKIFDVLSSY
jgi:O-antigen/teichoic acid export membrane protein